MSNGNSNAAGKVCEPCDDNPKKDSCTSSIDVKMTFPDKKIKEIILCGNESRFIQLIDKVNIVATVHDSAKVTLFTKNSFKAGVFAQKKTKSPYIADIDLILNRKCTVDEECSKGLFFGPTEQGKYSADYVNNTHSQRMYFAPVGNELGLHLDFMGALKKLAENKDVNVNFFTDNYSSTYRLVVAKRHLPEYTENFDYKLLNDGEEIFLDLPSNGIHYPLTIDIVPQFGFKTTFSIKDVNKVVGEISNNDQKNIQVANHKNDNPTSQKGYRKSIKGSNDISKSLELLGYKIEIKDTGIFYLGYEITVDLERSIQKLSETLDMLTGQKHLEKIKDQIFKKQSKQGKEFAPAKKPEPFISVNKPGITFKVDARMTENKDLTRVGLSWVFDISTDPLIGLTLKVNLVDMVLLAIRALAPPVAIGLEFALDRLGDTDNKYAILLLECHFKAGINFKPSVKITKKPGEDFQVELTYALLEFPLEFFFKLAGAAYIGMASGVFEASAKANITFSVFIKENKETKKIEAFYFNSDAKIQLKFLLDGSVGEASMNKFKSNNGSIVSSTAQPFSATWTVYDAIHKNNAVKIFTF